MKYFKSGKKYTRNNAKSMPILIKPNRKNKEYIYVY